MLSYAPGKSRSFRTRSHNCVPDLLTHVDSLFVIHTAAVTMGIHLNDCLSFHRSEIIKKLAEKLATKFFSSHDEWQELKQRWVKPKWKYCQRSFFAWFVGWRLWMCAKFDAGSNNRREIYAASKWFAIIRMTGNQVNARRFINRFPVHR